MINPSLNCPNFDGCSVNKCPLNPDYETLKNAEGDPFMCKAQKSTRKRLGVNLLNKGLRCRERAGERLSFYLKGKQEHSKLITQVETNTIGDMRV